VVPSFWKVCDMRRVTRWLLSYSPNCMTGQRYLPLDVFVTGCWRYTFLGLSPQSTDACKASMSNANVF
jgi:hypothetical protein